MTIDRGVVGRFVRATVAPLLECPDCSKRREQNDDGKDDAAFAGLRRRRGGAAWFDLFDVLLQCCGHDWIRDR
jgi:hypothetical protein